MPSPTFEFDGDVAAALLDETVHHAETEPGAFSLGGEERLEDPLADELGHPGAVVPDIEDDVGAGRQLRRLDVRIFADILLPRTDVDPPARGIGHRRGGVDAKVEDRRFEKAGIERDGGLVVAEIDVKLAVGADGVAQHRQHLGDEGFDVDPFGTQLLPARECQHLADEFLAALAGGTAHADQFTDLRILRQLAVHQVEAADDDGEDVVEVVRYAAGHLAERVEADGAVEVRVRNQALGNFVADLEDEVGLVLGLLQE